MRDVHASVLRTPHLAFLVFSGRVGHTLLIMLTRVSLAVQGYSAADIALAILLCGCE